LADLRNQYAQRIAEHNKTADADDQRLIQSNDKLEIPQFALRRAEIMTRHISQALIENEQRVGIGKRMKVTKRSTMLTEMRWSGLDLCRHSSIRCDAANVDERHVPNKI
jgi:hypothetical protein